MYTQMTAAKAREACQHWWMKEALDILVERLTSEQKRLTSEQNQRDEEDASLVSACSLSQVTDINSYYSVHIRHLLRESSQKGEEQRKRNDSTA